jgi:hypothetical protein
MKIVVISTIRNEADILETFVRYHLQFVDRMIIVNHRSVDSSADILNGLQQEGLSLDVVRETGIEHQQGSVLSRFMKKAVLEYDADWVIPLDADEFLAMKDEGRVREVMEKLPPDKVVKLPWRTYVPVATDNLQEPNILKRIQHYRSKENINLRKIMIPRSMATKKNGIIAAGNHGFVKESFRKQKEFPCVYTDQLVLAHFPVRSAQQITTKAFVGWLSCLVKPNKEPTEAFHLKRLYDRFKNGGQISPEELTSIAFSYATVSGTSTLLQNDIIHKPLVPEAGELKLRYTDTLKISPLPILAQMAEEFAEALGAMRKEQCCRRDDFLMRLRRWFLFWRK